MRFATAAALALIGATAAAQTIPDLTNATPVAGEWSYGPAADGSEAVFTNGSGFPQLWVHCTRATRRVTVARSATAAAPLLNIWTSSATRSIPSSFNPATGRLTVEFTNYDPLLDAMATSRGRIGLGIGSDAALVVPAWPELARVIEDCRA